MLVMRTRPGVAGAMPPVSLTDVFSFTEATSNANGDCAIAPSAHATIITVTIVVFFTGRSSTARRPTGRFIIWPAIPCTLRMIAIE